jgi:CIC family chloride channel protein
VLEEIVEDLNSRLLGRMLLASMVGALMAYWLVGPQPAFSLSAVEKPSWLVHVLAPFVAAFAALAGGVFQMSTMTLRQRSRGWHRVPPWLRPCIGALLTWGVAVAVFGATGHLGVFGLGYDDLSSALGGLVSWKTAALLLGAKLVATIACYATGGCGGIFSPTLFLGCMAGVSLGGAAGQFLPLDQGDQTTLAIVGMSACLGAVVRAPVTSIVIVFEMTHEFSLVPALMLGALASQAVARRMTPLNFYEAILRQDGHELERMIPPRDLDSWQSLPLSAIANFKPVCLPLNDAATTRDILRKNPYLCFPVVENGMVAGVVSRAEAGAALVAQRPAQLQAPCRVQPHHTVRQLQSMLVEATLHFAVVLDENDSRIIAVVTLHDLLRAQLAHAGRGLD